jgi:hypothetical protein
MTSSASRQAVDVLLMRETPAAPGTERRADVAVPWWVLLLVAVTGALLVAGAIRAVGLWHIPRPGAPRVSFPAARLVVLAVCGGAGRVFAVLVQAQSAISFGGRPGRERAGRRAVIGLAFLAQVPMVLGDLAVGLLAVTGELRPSSFLALEASPFNPLVLWSCLIFARGLKSFPEQFDNAARWKMVAGFAGYMYLIKLAVFGLTLAG